MSLGRPDRERLQCHAKAQTLAIAQILDATLEHIRLIYQVGVLWPMIIKLIKGNLQNMVSRYPPFRESTNTRTWIVWLGREDSEEP